MTRSRDATPPLAPVRILVVEDTDRYRQFLSELCASLAGVDVVGTAPDGYTALECLAHLRPDIVTLDVEMPTMDGMEALRQIHAVAPQVAVVMMSTCGSHVARATLDALASGAFDWVMKPAMTAGQHHVEPLRQRLQSIIQVWRAQHNLGWNSGHAVRQAPVRVSPPAAAGTEANSQHPGAVRGATTLEIVVIGVSTGGPQALLEVIPQLPVDLAAPVVIVQHMPQAFTRALATSLNDKSAVTVVEGQHGQRLAARHVYIAPGGKQMKIARQQQGPSLLLTDDPPENHCKPSVDYLFRSVAQLYAQRALGVLMTGMGADGVQGLRLMKQQGARTLAQDEASCVVFGMPMEAIKAGVIDTVVPLDQLAAVIIQHVGRR